MDPKDLVVEVRDVSKAFGRVPALSHLTILAPEGPHHRAARPERRRQDDRHPGDHRRARRPTAGTSAPSGSTRTASARTCAVDAASSRPSRRSTTGCRAGTTSQYSAELYGLGRNAIQPIREAAARFGILDALDQRVGGYSTGMKTRLALARSVLHDPELLLFDEPTSGLDPESSHAVLELIREMTADGHTVVMCTHLLIEAEGLADQIVVLENGTDLIHGTPGDADPAVLAGQPRAVRRRGTRASSTCSPAWRASSPSSGPTA